MPDSEVDRYRRVAGGVRKKLVAMALQHRAVRTEPTEAGPHTEPHSAPVEHDLGLHDGEGKGAAHMEGSDDSEFARAQKANERAEDISSMKDDQIEKHPLGKTGDEQHAMHEEQRDANRENQAATDVEHLAHAAQPKSGSEDHGWAEHETDAEHSAEPDAERMQAEDPGSGEADWQKTFGSRRIGKTAKGIIGAYRGGK